MKVERFRIDLQNVLNAYKKKLYYRKIHEVKRSSILLYFKPSTSARTANEPRPLTSMQADMQKEGYFEGSENAQKFCP